MKVIWFKKANLITIFDYDIQPKIEYYNYILEKLNIDSLKTIEVNPETACFDFTYIPLEYFFSEITVYIFHIYLQLTIDDRRKIKW